MQPNQASEYFKTARERYRIKLHRESGGPRPYSVDPIFQQWRFCNVFREDDKTTVWFRENIRNHAADPLRATAIFRWFNRIETGEKIKDLILNGWDTEEARRRLQHVNPVVTGAYIIKGMDGYNKLDGVLYCIDHALPVLDKYKDQWESDSVSHPTTLQEAWSDLCDVYYLGRFMAYEIVSDLRWTPLLNRAPDIMEWANAGPGCSRGLEWITGETLKPGSVQSQNRMNVLMRELLEMSQDPVYWPSGWPQWEMREVEHWACEFDKYKRAQEGMKLKRRFT
jgi:hypothetical protein